MADVSKIKVPNGTVYDLKDETARAGLAGKADARYPTIEGMLSLTWPGNATTENSIFSWENTLRLRNQDPNAENATYTDLLLTPNGIFTEGAFNGNIIDRKKILTAGDSVDNANKLGGVVGAYHLGTLGSSNNEHGYYYQLYCKHNVYGDNRFGLEIANRTHEVRVDYATYANNALTHSKGIISGLTNGTAVTIPLSFSPVAVILFNGSNHMVNGGFSLSLGTNQFVITPSSVAAMGTTAVTYVAFRG